MSFWTPDNIKSVIGGAWIARDPSAAAPPLTGLSIDSRAVKPGEIFLAFRGERTDGHSYLNEAAAAGARLLIVSSPLPKGASLPKSVGVLQVADTGAALLKLGAAYRKTLETTRVIAVGGSNGKTTTCRLLQAVLSRTLRGTVSPKSFNNAIGVPLTILAAKRTDQYLICEVGTNAPGEIAPLAAVVEPDIAIITSIGREHLEGLGSLRGVVTEEASLVGGLRPGGWAIINADPPMLGETVRTLLTSGTSKGQKPPSVLTFGHSDAADLRIIESRSSTTGVWFKLNDRTTYSLGLLGLHNAANAAAAISVARRLGVPQHEIESGLANCAGPEMRMERSLVEGTVFVNDAYNANPESALAAIRTFSESFINAPDISRRVLILGDMLELGSGAPDLHREIGDAIAAARCFDLVILVGHLVMYAGERLTRTIGPQRVVPFTDTQVDAAEIAALLKPGDAVLLKGSRRMALERIIAARRNTGASIIEPAPRAGAPATQTNSSNLYGGH